MSFREDIKRPFNQVSLALGLAGIGLALYFYFFPRNERSIAYVSEGPSLIFDSKLSTPKLRLLDTGDKPVTSDTYLHTFTVWNNGTHPIEPDDVRKPVRFEMNGAERILDYRITSSTDTDICGFTLASSSDSSASNNTVELRWKHFDPKKAVKVQIIFAQSDKPRPSINANIIGIDKFASGRKERNWMQAMMMLLLAPTAFSGVSIIRKSVNVNSKLKWIPIGIGLLVILFFVGGVYLALSQTLTPTPPL